MACLLCQNSSRVPFTWATLLIFCHVDVLNVAWLFVSLGFITSITLVRVIHLIIILIRILIYSYSYTHTHLNNDDCIDILININYYKPRLFKLFQFGLETIENWNRYHNLIIMYQNCEIDEHILFLTMDVKRRWIIWHLKISKSALLTSALLQFLRLLLPFLHRPILISCIKKNPYHLQLAMTTCWVFNTAECY